MLKNLLEHRRTTKYALVVTLPLEGMDNASDTQIEDAMQATYFRVQKIITQLGYRPRALAAGMYLGGVKVHAVVRASSDEEVAQLLTAINLRLRRGSAERVATIDKTGERELVLTPRMAFSAA